MRTPPRPVTYVMAAANVRINYAPDACSTVTLTSNTGVTVTLTGSMTMTATGGCG